VEEVEEVARVEIEAVASQGSRNRDISLVLH